MANDIERWLKELGLEQYLAAFREHRIEPELLPSLTAEDLREMGVTAIGHRRLLLDAIRTLPARSAEPQLALPAETPTAAVPEAAGSERRRLTVFFCDMVGSSEIASRTDPEETQEILARFQATCVAEIQRHGGYIAQYLGDGLLALFGFPHARENEAERALRAGLAVLHAVARGGPARPAVRIGVATGLVVVGELVQGGLREERAVVGQAPNLAARFQALAKPGELICGAITRRLAGELFDYEALPPQEIKGFPGLINTWRVVGERSVESRFEAVRHRGSTRMVGREAEIDLLLDRWSTARDGEGQVALIGGDAGIGKSRLLQRFFEETAGEPRLRVTLQCSPHYQDSALFPAIRHLEMSAGMTARDSVEERVAKLERFVSQLSGAEPLKPMLAKLLSLDETEVSADEPPERTRRRILEALTGLIELNAAEGPVLVVVEDVHWIDPSTQELIDLLIQRIAEKRVMLVVTYRLDFGCPWTRTSYATTLTLNRLSRSQSLALIDGLAAGRALAPELRREIVEKTDGIPLFVEEVVRALLDHTGFDGEGMEVAQAVSVPDTLTDTLLSRLDRDLGAKQVAQVAAVIGREFSFPLLAMIADMDEVALSTGLTRLLDAGLIEQLPSGGETYVFKHGLLQEATYDTLLLRRRSKLHRRIASALETRFAELGEKRPEMVARHYAGAGMAEKAAQRWLEAGKQALKIGAYGEALQHLKSGLASLNELPDAAGRQALELNLQMAKAEALRSARFTSGDDALAACQRARVLAEALGDVGRQVQSLRLELGINVNRPDIAGIERVAGELRRIAEQHGDGIARVLADQSMGCVYFLLGKPLAAEESLRASLAAAEKVTDREALARLQYPTTALSYLALSVALTGRIDAARKISRTSVTLAEAHSRFSHGIACTNALILCHLIGDEGVAEDLARRLHTIAEARGIPYWIDLAGFHLGYKRLLHGDAVSGAALMRRAIETFRATAVEIEVPFYLSLLAGGLIRAGRNKEALAALEDAFTTGRRTQERWVLPELLRLKGEALAPDDAAAAETQLREAMTIARAQDAMLLELRASISLARLSAGKQTKTTLRSRVAQLSAGLEQDFAGPDRKGAEAVLDEAQ